MWRIRDHRARSSIDVEEGIAGEEHLAEICPFVMAGVGLGGLCVPVALCFQETPGGVLLVSNGRSVDTQEEGLRDPRVLIGRPAGAACAVMIQTLSKLSCASMTKSEFNRLSDWSGIVEGERRVQVLTIEARRTPRAGSQSECGAAGDRPSGELRPQLSRRPRHHPCRCGRSPHRVHLGGRRALRRQRAWRPGSLQHPVAGEEIARAVGCRGRLGRPQGFDSMIACKPTIAG